MPNCLGDESRAPGGRCSRGFHGLGGQVGGGECALTCPVGLQTLSGRGCTRGRLCGVSPRALLSGELHAGAAARRTAGVADGQRGQRGSEGAEEGEGQIMGLMASRAGGWQHDILGALVGLAVLVLAPRSTHAAPVCPSTQPPNEGYLRVPMHPVLCCRRLQDHAIASAGRYCASGDVVGGASPWQAHFETGTQDRMHLPTRDLHLSVSIHLLSIRSQRHTYHDSCLIAALA
jgi:hypothetical protein